MDLWLIPHWSRDQEPAKAYVVEDDDGVRRAIERLVRSTVRAVEGFATADAFLKAVVSDRPGCVLLDLRLPGMDGLELQQRLAATAPSLAVIVITGHGDIALAVHAMKAGAADFISKPVDQRKLLPAVDRSLADSTRRYRTATEVTALRGQYRSLTRRQREVMGYVLQGMLNKQIADRMSISEKTVKVHRHEVMTKMRVRSVATLAHVAHKAVLSPPDPPGGEVTPSGSEMPPGAAQ